MIFAITEPRKIRCLEIRQKSSSSESSGKGSRGQGNRLCRQVVACEIWGGSPLEGLFRRPHANYKVTGRENNNIIGDHFVVIGRRNKGGERRKLRATSRVRPNISQNVLLTEGGGGEKGKTTGNYEGLTTRHARVNKRTKYVLQADKRLGESQEKEVLR